jgi:ankyrin repeat protein
VLRTPVATLKGRATTTVVARGFSLANYPLWRGASALRSVATLKGRATTVVLVLSACAGLSAAPSDPRLIDAVKGGNRETVRTLLRARVNVNAPEADGTTALHWAVRADDVEMVRVLLRGGADAKVTNRYSATQLSLAAANGNPATIEMLLDAGADANTTSPDGETVLMTAALTGRADAVRELLDHGADVNASERAFGETPLMWAAAHNHRDVIRLLLDYGAGLDTRSKRLEFPKITFNGSTMVSTLMPRGGLTAVMFAARQGALESVRDLSDAGADLNVADPDGTSATLMAIINLHYDVAKLLLDKGADPNIADASGMAPLYGVIEMRTSGRLINRPSRKPSGSLDSLELLKALLERGVNPNARLKTPTLQRYHNPGDPQLALGATPLMRAAKFVDLPAMRLLLDHGANPNLMTATYTTPLMLAASAAGGRNRSLEDNAIAAISLCVERGADINAFTNNGLTSLHLAVERGADGIVKFLAEKGAELDLKDKDGRTPLDIALGVPASGFTGRRGAAPAVVRESTAALLRQLMGSAAPAPAQTPPPTHAPTPAQTTTPANP